MLSRDPLQGDLRDPQSLNPYSYVQNRPLSFTDPSGFACKDSNTETCVTAPRLPDPWWPFLQPIADPSGAFSRVQKASEGLILEIRLDALLQALAGYQKLGEFYAAEYGININRDTQPKRTEPDRQEPSTGEDSSQGDDGSTGSTPQRDQALADRPVLPVIASGLALSSDQLVALRLAGPLVGPLFSILEATGQIQIPAAVEPFRKEIGGAQVVTGIWSVSQGVLLFQAAAATGSAAAVPVIFVGGGAFGITRGIDNLSGGTLTRLGSDGFCSVLGGC